MELPNFSGFPKIPRLSRECIITEKIDGTNASVFINDENTEIVAASRSRWIQPGNDNHGFARWVQDNRDELLRLGPGRHFGEWWGQGIQRAYSMKQKRFSLFNVSRWTEDNTPDCVSVVPTLAIGMFHTDLIDRVLNDLIIHGSYASDENYVSPEGIVVYHVASGVMFKKTIKGDEAPKGVGR